MGVWENLQEKRKHNALGCWLEENLECGRQPIFAEWMREEMKVRVQDDESVRIELACLKFSKRAISQSSFEAIGLLRRTSWKFGLFMKKTQPIHIERMENSVDLYWQGWSVLPTGGHWAITMRLVPHVEMIMYWIYWTKLSLLKLISPVPFYFFHIATRKFISKYCVCILFLLDLACLNSCFLGRRLRPFLKSLSWVHVKEILAESWDTGLDSPWNQLKLENEIIYMLNVDSDS